MSEVGMRSVSEKETTEVPKHRKKKQSSTSNARTKSKHKHIYKDCLFFDNKYEEHHKGKYCLICGRIGHVDRIETVKMQGGWRRKLTENEICEKYKHLEPVVVENIFQKFIVLGNGDDE